MTPKEKAVDLIDKFKVWRETGLDEFGYDISEAKKHALICVEEIKSAIENDQPDDPEFEEQRLNYWEEVEHEIEIYETSN